MDFRKPRTLKVSSMQLRNAEPPPAGTYQLHIVEQTVSDRQERDALVITFEVSAGEYEGRRVAQLLYVDDHRRLAELVRACGLLDGPEFDELEVARLSGCELCASLAIETSDDGKTYARLYSFQAVDPNTVLG